MKRFRQSDCGERGWFIGAYPGALIETDACEVAYDWRPAGEISPKHYHKIATEVTLIISGCIEVGGERFGAGEGFVIEPGEATECRYIEDTTQIVVKIPGVAGDKYLA